MSYEAVFLVGFVLGACSLALFSTLYKALKPDGVRALRQEATFHCKRYTVDDVLVLPHYPELRIFSEAFYPSKKCFLCNAPIEPYVRYVESAGLGLRHENEWDQKEASMTRSANAVNPQIALDSPSERQQQKERRES